VSRPSPRVLQVVLSLNPGGTERLVIEIVRRLQHDIQMAVCCLDEPGSWATDLERAGVPVESLGRTPGFRPSLGGDVARAAARHGAEILHCHHYSPFVYGVLSRLWAPYRRLVYTEHGRFSDAPPSPKRRLVNRVLAPGASRVFAVSDDLKQHMVTEGFSSDAVGVIHNGIDVGPLPTPDVRSEVRRELQVGDDTLVIGSIARLDPVKDLGTLIRATSALSRGLSTTLVIVGDGPEQEALKKTVAELTPRPDVRFLGHRDDARRWLAACDVYVNCSISEGVSLTILEAMAAGLPIVATAVGGTPEVLDAESGRLVPSRNAAALEAALRELAEDRALGGRLGAGARRRVEARFTLDRMVEEYRAVYGSLLPA